MNDTKDTTSTLYTVAVCLLIAAVSWYLLQQLAGLLRPLVLAVFLAYIILPAHYHLTRRLPQAASYLVLGGGTLCVLYGLALMIYSSAVELSDKELPRLIDRGQTIAAKVHEIWHERFAWLAKDGGDGGQTASVDSQQLRNLASRIAAAAADVMTEAVVTGFYLLFLLLEAHRFPRRVRTSFIGDQGGQIMDVASRVNLAIADYLKAKVKASLILAIPVTLVLWIFGVKFALLWGVLTFLCNFIPYLGSIVAVASPLAFAFLDLDDWRFFAVAAGVLTTHLVMTYIVEPTITSRAVGLSPLVILFSLAFWGQCWGLIGMFLAVPLTVSIKIVLENVAFTRPFAELLGDRISASEPEA